MSPKRDTPDHGDSTSDTEPPSKSDDSSSSDDDDDEDDDLVSFDPERDRIDDTSCSSSSNLSSGLAMSVETSPYAHRNKVAMEIMDSERSYLSDIILAHGLFLVPLKAGVVKRITQKKVSRIFGNMEQLIEINSLLYSKLSERKKIWHDEQCLADIFVEFAPMFIMYGEYCQNYGDGCELLKRLELKSDVNQFLLQVGEENHAALRSLGLHDLLIMPVQRLPRYLLLLRDLLKDTEPSHPDYQNIQNAISKIKVVTETVNEQIRLAERHQKLLELERRITVNRHGMPRLIQPGRGLIREGKLGKITSRFTRKGVRFFLMTDLLLYAYRIRGGNKKQPCKLHYKGSIPLGTAWLRNLQDGDGYRHLFQVVSPQKTYTLFAEDAMTKDAWMKEINHQIVQLVSKDPSLRSKRGEARHSSRTKNLQPSDSRFTRSPRSIRRFLNNYDDLLAPPPPPPALLEQPITAKEAELPLVPAPGDIYSDEKMFIDPPHLGSAADKKYKARLAAAQKKNKKKGGVHQLPLLHLDEEGYHRFTGDEDEDDEDNAISDSTEPTSTSSLTTSSTTATTTANNSSTSSSTSPNRPGSQLGGTPPQNPARIIDPLSAGFSPESPHPSHRRTGSQSSSTRPPVKPKNPNEQTALTRQPRANSRLHSRPEDNECCSCDPCGIL